MLVIRETLTLERKNTNIEKKTQASVRNSSPLLAPSMPYHASSDNQPLEHLDHPHIIFSPFATCNTMHVITHAKIKAI
jgi:hypothetical protein